MKLRQDSNDLITVTQKIFSEKEPDERVIKAPKLEILENKT